LELNCGPWRAFGNHKNTGFLDQLSDQHNLMGDFVELFFVLTYCSPSRVLRIVVVIRRKIEIGFCRNGSGRTRTFQGRVIRLWVLNE